MSTQRVGASRPVVGPAEDCWGEDVRNPMPEQDKEGEQQQEDRVKADTAQLFANAAWGTGGVELVQEGGCLEIWEIFVEDKENNQIRQENVMPHLGVISDKDDVLDSLLMYFLWPGPSAIQIPAGEVYGTAQEERLLRRGRELRNGASGGQRIRIFQEMEDIRKEIAQSIRKRTCGVCTRVRNTCGITSSKRNACNACTSDWKC
jgi:hypothetical protein